MNTIFQGGGKVHAKPSKKRGEPMDLGHPKWHIHWGASACFRVSCLLCLLVHACNFVSLLYLLSLTLSLSLSMHLSIPPCPYLLSLSVHMGSPPSCASPHHLVICAYPPSSSCFLCHMGLDPSCLAPPLLSSIPGKDG